MAKVAPLGLSLVCPMRVRRWSAHHAHRALSVWRHCSSSRRKEAFLVNKKRECSRAYFANRWKQGKHSWGTARVRNLVEGLDGRLPRRFTGKGRTWNYLGGLQSMVSKERT